MSCVLAGFLCTFCRNLSLVPENGCRESPHRSNTFLRLPGPKICRVSPNKLLRKICGVPSSGKGILTSRLRKVSDWLISDMRKSRLELGSAISRYVFTGPPQKHVSMSFGPKTLNTKSSVFFSTKTSA